MIKNGMTVSEAAHEWVREMNAYPQDMIKTLMDAKPDDWHEVTMPRVGDRVYVYELPEDGTENTGEIREVNDDVYSICLDDDVVVDLTAEDFEVERDDWLPMWGWMWSFGDSADDYFMTDLDGIKIMSECGFRIYEHEEWGYFFGIDGCGYSFYEEHWIPAYRARGLKWHDERTERTDEDVKNILLGLGVTSCIVDKVMEIQKHDPLRIGGYYGGYLSKKDAKKISECDHFSIRECHEKVQEMSHLADNDYYVIARLV